MTPTTLDIVLAELQAVRALADDTNAMVLGLRGDMQPLVTDVSALKRVVLVDNGTPGLVTICQVMAAKLDACQKASRNWKADHDKTHAGYEHRRATLETRWLWVIAQAVALLSSGGVLGALWHAWRVGSVTATAAATVYAPHWVK
jgi:hypothetical protein